MTKPNRKQEILGTLAAMLETSHGQRITTARLAADLGVSEAALYRHFPSKARMFEGLIEFTEDTLLSRINQIIEVEKDVSVRCQMILKVVLTFIERNPGISRVLSGDALLGEHERLRARVKGLFDKIEASLKQTLREHGMRAGFHQQMDEAAFANLLLSYVEGKLGQFVRSEFKTAPTAHFDQHWHWLAGPLA
ncbi:nucleoid occlusion factor SlmA [Pseudidiomarina taiwanensis]|uniref:Nucleoid occlusion factor SlmA n=1 Tax=Pseudidiomarina taiwanensis TaxID=337250 RepID=A0A432ZL03_9GAMM|nr:nucleoid occlusion factor SlmA [Pseudidiomarina taiwanensis]RUO78677.1 nucleoid occlusion factor SlmA [Pseudidiomarina taiwanensis]